MMNLYTDKFIVGTHIILRIPQSNVFVFNTIWTCFVSFDEQLFSVYVWYHVLGRISGRTEFLALCVKTTRLKLTYGNLPAYKIYTIHRLWCIFRVFLTLSARSKCTREHIIVCVFRIRLHRRIGNIRRPPRPSPVVRRAPQQNPTSAFSRRRTTIYMTHKYTCTRVRARVGTVTAFARN